MRDRFQIGSGDVIFITGGIKYIPEGQGGLQIRAKPLLANSQIDKPERVRAALCCYWRTYKVSIQLNTGVFANTEKIIHGNIIISAGFFFSSGIDIVYYLIICLLYTSDAADE